ncbi:MAG TPA: type II secretion system F family protein [Candidatus Dormibacteraeota bacterium]|nr:type II secretion system F family protein [Candidatus Dormibacteraeota bacterium]
MTISLLLGLVFAAGLFVVFMSLDRKGAVADEHLEQRLKGYGEIEPTTLDQIELQKSFEERVLRPQLERIGRILSDRTPQKSRDSLRYTLALAGNPGNLSVGGFQALRDVAAGLGVVLGGLLGLLVGHTVGLAIGLAAGALIGFYAPMYWLNSLTGGRRIEIQKALPDAMDLLTIASEAGQSFDAAITNVVEKYQNALADEFATVMRETQLGRPRLEALEDMGKRCGVEDLNNFVQSVIQSEQMGVGISKILRIQSQELRRKRRQRAQEQAAQATLKMMLPMVGCIFPTLWIILLGPAVLVILKARSGG